MTRWTFGETIDSGAQGIVLRAFDRDHPERKLVAKKLRAKASRENLAAEFALLSRLRLRGLARVYDFGVDADGMPFFVEDFAEGPDIVTFVATGRDPAEKTRRLARVIADVAATLVGLHAAGYVHGDVKPAHVRIAHETMLLDLGTAVMRGADARGYSKGFAAPEVVAGATATEAGDVYALGATALATKHGPPSLVAIFEAMTAKHPADRPTARDVLARLGRSQNDALAGSRPAPLGRDREIEAIVRSQEPVLYVTGAPGCGKSYLLEEAAVQAALQGRAVRFVSFPGDESAVAPLAAFFRGARTASPFSEDRNALLLVDSIESAPRELASAIESHRCMRVQSGVSIVAIAKRVPRGAQSLEVGSLSEDAFRALCTDVGIEDIDGAARASHRLPGWVLASAGRMPLSPEAVLERTRSLEPAAKELFAKIAICGDAPHRLVGGNGAATTLLANGLVQKTQSGFVMAPAIAASVAKALGSCALVDSIADVLLDGDLRAPKIALALATSDFPPTRRTELLDRGARDARALGLRAEEIALLLDLVTDPKERTAQRIVRLERLTRDTADAVAHARATEMLEALAETDASVRVLAGRRTAERLARQGKKDEALAVAEKVARESHGDPHALATLGIVRLHTADYRAAFESLREASALLDSAGGGDDPEESARLHHNLGVVALYRDDLDRAIDAFSRSLETKRKLGDLAGARSCFMNLGLALTRAGRFAEATSALDDAIRLARALDQTSGLGWSLIARADVDVRRGDGVAAEPFVAEAAALEGSLPASVHADIAVVGADADTLLGRGDDALAKIARVPADVRKADPYVDARALVIEGRAQLSRLPADRRAAARFAIRAIRRSRGASLRDMEERAILLLQTSRTRKPRAKLPTVEAKPFDWSVLGRIARSEDRESAVGEVLRALVSAFSAERAFVMSGDDAWGMDTDGLAISDAQKRIPEHQKGESYTPDAAGKGSLLTVLCEDTMVIVQHRFLTSAFDAIPMETARRFAELAHIAARFGGEQRVEASSVAIALVPRSAPSLIMPTTVVPAIPSGRRYPEIIGGSSALRRAVAKLDAAVESDLPVLILGETGTGKEVFARALHDHGPRGPKPFAALNCAAIPESLFEAELFGHMRGAFTGADRARDGVLARAEGGTIFLDEIGELAPPRQAALLRALETRRFRPVGADTERAFDVRIIAATNRDLEHEVTEKRFRSDLYFRLRVLEIALPPLRDRDGDVPLLIHYFLRDKNVEVTPAAQAALACYAWPGNVRELGHLIDRLVAMRIRKIDALHLPREIRAAKAPARVDERTEVETALAATGGNISHAATRMGITRHGLKKKMLRLGLRSKS